MKKIVEELKNTLVCKRWKSTVCWVLLFTALAVLIQWRTGAYQAEFGSEPDEAAHFVTGLVLRDYVGAHLPGNPMTFANDYYNHYPKVALGHWPPVFYLMQSGWELAFGVSRNSVLLLMAFLTGLAATILFFALVQEFGELKAIAGCIVFLSIPMVQEFTGAIMTEMPITFFLLLGTVFYIRFLEREKVFDAAAYGVIATIAILTKFSALSLALLPPLAVIFSRKFYLCKRFAFWLPACIAVLPVGLWTAATLKLASDGLEDHPGLAFTRKAIPYFGGKFFAVAGFALVGFALLGFVTQIIAPRKIKPAYAVFGALLVAVFALVILVPAGFEARHLIPALPAVVFLAWAEAESFARALTRWGLHRKIGVITAFGVLLAAFGAEKFQFTHKGYFGFGPVAQDLLADAAAKKTSFLVASDARGEGMFISEVALHEKRPGHIVQRASKKLAGSGWNGNAYRMMYTMRPSDKTGQEYHDEAELLALLKKDSIGYFILDESLPKDKRAKHLELLQQTIESHPETFVLEKSYSLERAGTVYPNAIKLYRKIS